MLPSVLLSFVTAAAAVAAPSERLPEAAAIAALKAHLQEEVADGRFSGAVLIAKDGKPIFESAYGDADRERKIPNAVTTKFRFGSMGKMFTAVAVMQLVEAEKIRLDDPIGKYLPHYPNKDVAAVTIYELLTHTGGTGDIFGPQYDAHRLELKTLEDYIAEYGNRGLEFQPGSKWDYSNYGFVLLGRIIEVASGQSYYDYTRDRVFIPAGMLSTGNAPEDQKVRDLSISYTRGDFAGPGPGPGAGPPPGPGDHGTGPSTHSPSPDARPSQRADAPLQSTAEMLPYRGTSAGGGYSTVGDFLKFVDALQSHRLLDSEHTELLTTGKVSTPRPGIKYAFGFEDQLAPDGVRFFGHGGGSPGMNGRLSIFPASHYVVVVLANLDPPAADAVARFIGDRLPAQ
jgi:D-alanyl-D-alanine carboxypeptidase